MTPQAFAIASLFSATVFRIYGLASGWNADPTFLFSLFVPFVIIPLFVFPILFAPVSLFCLAPKDSWRLSVGGKSFTIGVAFLAAFVAAPTPFLPTSSDAFRWRMASFSEADFMSLAVDARSEMAKRDLDSLMGNHYDAHDQIVDALRPRHPVLLVSSFPLEIFATNTHVSIEWASGLTGGYEISIIDGDSAPQWMTKPNLYENVSAYSK